MAKNISSMSRRLLVSAFLLFLMACSQNSNSPDTPGGGGGTGPTNGLPVATITQPAAATNTETGYTLTFKGTATDPDASDTIQSFVWDFGDGSSPVTVLATADPNGTITHAFTGTLGIDKSFNVSLKAVDSRGLQGNAATVTITVPAYPGPKASVTVPTPAASGVSLKIAPGETYTFRAAVDPTTLLPGLTVKSYVWKFGDGTPSETVDAVAKPDGAVTHAFASATGAPFSVTVTATSSLDNPGPASSAVSVDVNASYANQAPTVSLAAVPAISAGPDATYQNVSVAFTATASDPNGDTLTYAWDFGDGSTLAAAPGTSPVTQNHTYASAGVRVVRVTVDDGRVGGSKTVSLSLNVLANAAPTLTVAKTSPSGSLYANVPATFTATGSDPNGDPLTYTWDFGDGTTPVAGTSPSQVHAYVATGAVTLTVTADDLKGGKATATLPLSVLANAAPVSTITSAPTGNLYQTKPYAFTASATDPDSGDTIASYEWDFGDGTPTLVTTTGTATHAYATTVTGAKSVRVRATDSKGGLGSYSPAATVTVIATSLPVVSFVLPSGAQTIQAPLGGYVDLTFKLQATSPNAAGGAASPIALSGITFAKGDAAAMVQSSVANGDGTYTFVVRYPAASATGTRTSTPTGQATDSLGIVGTVANGPVITVQTTEANTAPVITVTTPATDPSSAFTSKQVSLGFNLKDAEGDAVTYSVDWGDGTAPETGTAASGTGSGSGFAASVTHVYADAFAQAPNPSPRSATITITATDNKSVNATASPQSRTVNVTFNTLPTANITSPQKSVDLSGIDTVALGINDGADVVVIPNKGKLSFAGTGTAPLSGGTITYGWTFQGGVPASASGATANDVVFAGVAGQIKAYAVDFVVTDDTGVAGRTSTNNSAVTTQMRRKWVVVDGTKTYNFNLAFRFRQKADNNGTSSTAFATQAATGLGASVQVFQDGVTTSWLVSSGGEARVAIPMRNNLPFWVQIPSFGGDSRSYLLRVPNAAGQDPTFEAGTTVDSRFFFSGGEPTLWIVTGQGFAAENAIAASRRLQGIPNVYGNTGTPANERWLDRLSVPLDPYTLGNGADPVGNSPLQWLQSSNAVGTFSGIPANQLFAEWTLIPRSEAGNSTILPPAEQDADTVGAANSAGMGFIVDYAKYTGDTQKSESFPVRRLQAFRVPAGSTDPYDLNVAGMSSSGVSSEVVELNPTHFTAGGAVPTFLQSAVWDATGTTAFSRGMQGLSIPYDANDPNRTPKSTPGTYNFQPIRQVFSYAEYLWTSVWARPFVLNRSTLNYTNSQSINAYGFFRNSQPAAWPSKSGITPDNSAFNLTANGGTNFIPAASAVATPPASPSTNAVGRFYWTAFTPFYNANGGALISRTWLADAAGLPPTSFSGSATGDATAAYGFVPPQDTVVDKRGRNANGSLNGQALGGYRVTWFNATKDASSGVVAPDFWVIELDKGTGNVQHFLLPASFPAGTQAVTDLILTDARRYLPSGSTTLQAGDSVAPGYCWFDIPVELRPTAGATLTVFAVKAILKNNAPAGARTINRSEWIDAVKTASATLKAQSSGGADVSYAHKLPFNYYWDIVVVNGPRTPVAP